MTSLVVWIALMGVGQRVVDPPPLAQPQIAQIRELIQATRTYDTKIKSQLVQRQQELIAEYAEFELDERRIKRLQEEVVDLQRQLLANYHRFQIGLRQATGPEHFQAVKSRVDSYLRSKEGTVESKDPPPVPQKRIP